MEPIELRDLDLARRYVVEGLWLQRAVKPSAATVRPILEWAMEVASGGHPLPPIGFIADVGHIAFGADAEHRQKDPLQVPRWPHTLARSYEDHVLGKLYADWMFERAGDALRKYLGKDRTKGLAYVLNQIRERAGTGGVMLPPAVIRGLLSINPDEVLSSGWDSLMRDGPLDVQVQLYEELAAAGRRMNEVLAKEDIDALEDRSALGDMGQYVALRQIRQTTAKFESRLPARPVRPLTRRKEVPTRIHDEDQYPVGGYTSLSTRGSIESLLQSQLAYMEKETPDLFDMKFVRDELFYYSRDENQFLRRRRAFVFVLFPDLLAARFKDPELPLQRIVMLQSAILALVRRLTEWLSTDAIRFEVLFVQDGEKKSLQDEATLTQLLLREPIERGDARVEWLADQAAVATRLQHLSRLAQVHCLAVATEPFEMDLDNVVVTELVVSGPRPEIGDGDGVVAELEGEDALDVWQETVLRILQLWV
jgi:vWA domain found in the FtsH ternary systems/N-terminal helical region fused to the FtsH ternary system vWA domain